MAAEANLERALCPVEATIWYIDSVLPLNFAVFGEIEGPVDEEALRACMPFLQKRHARLQNRIVLAKGSPRLVTGDVPPPSLRVVHTDNWQLVLDEELYTPMPWETGPLVRFTLVRTGNDKSILIANFCHVIGDAKSGVFLIRDLLECASKGSENAVLPQLRILPSITDLIPETYRGKVAKKSLRGFLFKVLGAILRKGWPVGPILESRPGLLQQRCFIIPRVFDRSETAQFAQSAREHGVTLHSLLLAAYAIGILEARDVRKKRTLALGSPVDLRKRLEPALGEEIGLLVSMCASLHVVDKDVDIWQLAKEAREGLLQFINEEQGHLKITPAQGGMFFPLVRFFSRTFGMRRFWTRFIAMTQLPAFGLTNIGTMPIPTEYGEMHVQWMGFAAQPSILGQHITTACTVNGRLSWNTCFMSPQISRPNAERYVARSEEILRQATGLPARAN